DDFHESLRVNSATFDSVLRAQFRMADWDQARVVLGHALDGARAHAGDDAQEPFAASDLRRPAEGIFAEAHTGHIGKEGRATPAPGYALQQYRHALIVIDEIILFAI